ncbi:Polymerase, nucleotidyl transferase domain [Fusarium oxysporum f. sp. vasinfectum]|nr:Polymerase, nucleotidyl transferase domain [Fusarium oxysporum f. sp. vasinfectum]
MPPRNNRPRNSRPDSRPRNDRPPRPDTDSYRPGDRYDLPPRPPRDNYGQSDSYRPRVPQGDFTFRVDKPAGMPDFPTDYRGPSDRRGPRRDGGRGGGRGRGRGGRKWQPPPHPSERALVSGATANMPEERLGEEGAAKFRDVDELSDDDELEMDISSSSETEGPSKKRAKTGDDDSGDAAPKWSNPDPYTALPCPDESTRKKRDMVKLIRKARVEDQSEKLAASTEAEDFISNDPLGSRKRTADDEIKPPDYGQLKKATTKPSKGALLPSWQPKATEDPCPWDTVDHSATMNMPFRLHKEIIDFYEYVRPRDFEQRIRDNLVENLRKAMRRDGRNFASASVHPFGSFMSGLYLPTADMDLVVCSASFMRGGPPTYLSAKSWLYKFQKFLTSQHVADQHSIEVIAHARVPLVKYVDKQTGLKVDVSFENLGGVNAVDTFLEWKAQYPAMPILVTVIKHFLLMRGLNEPVNGGIGGFTVICLVVSMLQLMPQVQSRNLIPEHHLGEMLLEFFHLYGREFRHDTNAISLTRPIGYIRKSEVRSLTYKNYDRLSIIDPNNSGNDISGGSSNTVAILDRFKGAFHLLRDRMDEIARDPNQGNILEVILRGDYSSFRMQRDFLRHVHEKHIGPLLDYLWGDTSKEEKRLIRKLDFFILTFCCFSFFFNHLDRQAFANAYVAGLKEALELSGNQYNVLLSMASAGMLVGQIPSSIIIHKIRPRIWMSSMVVVWAGLTMASAACKTYAQLCAVRFLMGLAEASTYAGSIYIMGSWYKSNEIAKRTAMFTVAGQVGKMFAGAMMAAIHESMEGHAGLEGWQWVFLIDGIITLPVAIFGFFFFPDVPEYTDASYLSDKERQLALDRLPPKKEDGHDIQAWSLVKRVMGHPLLYVCCVFSVLGSALQSYVVQGLMLLYLKFRKDIDGFTQSEVNTLPIPTHAVGIVAELSVSFFMDRYNRRMSLGFLLCSIQIICSIVLLIPGMSVAGNLTALYLSASAYGINPLLYGWSSNILARTADDAARSVTLASMAASDGLLWTFWGIVMFPADHAPYWRNGYIGMLCVSAAMVGWLFAVRWLDRYTAEKYPAGEHTSVSSLVVTEVNYSTMDQNKAV